MSELLTNCNNKCPFYSNDTCLKPNGLICPQASTTINCENAITISITEKQLEVLKVLKKYITIFENPNTVEKFRYIYAGGYITKEEYDLLKEWLENDYR